MQIIIDQKEPDNVEYFQLFGKHHNKWSKVFTGDKIQDCHKSSILQEEDSFHQQIGLKILFTNKCTLLLNT